METPIRVQRKRTKGFKLPENTVCVTRGTKWGNPYKIGDVIPATPKRLEIKIEIAEDAVNAFWKMIVIADAIEEGGHFWEIRQNLKGKNLACFCPLDKPCHADILLKIANEQ